MQVDVADVAVDIAGKRAVVELTQTWSSGRFGDRGRKRLIFEEGADGVRLIGEEMLDSTLILTSEACVRGHYPGYRHARPKVETDDGVAMIEAAEISEDEAFAKEHFVCVIKVLDPERDQGEFVVSVFARAGNRWRDVATATHEFPYAVPPPLDGDESGSDLVSRVTKDATAEVAFVAISPREKALVFTMHASTQGWEYGSTSTQKHFYRLRGDELEDVLTLSSESSGGEGPEESHTEEAEVLTTMTDGYYDIRRVRRDVSEDMIEGTRDASEASRILSWSDGRYVEQ
jgi:hypothetical protein